MYILYINTQTNGLVHIHSQRAALKLESFHFFCTHAWWRRRRTMVCEETHCGNDDDDGTPHRPELRLSRSYNEQDFFRLYFLVSLNRTLITTRQMCGALNAINLKITYWWFLINECGAGKHYFFLLKRDVAQAFFTFKHKASEFRVDSVSSTNNYRKQIIQCH